MKIITLVENTCGQEDCIAEHGLSLYIETEKHRLLLDAGQTDAVVKNAEAVGVDLSAVDTVILSHGHYDHSGGIIPLSKINSKAQIIMQRRAAEPHYNGERYIGIDKAILDLPNVRLIDGDLHLDDELFLFSGITGRRCYPQGNCKLSRMKYFKDNASDSSSAKYFLTVDDFNLRAKKLYENLGYKCVGELPDFYKNGINCYLMMKRRG